ncbi:hypothetical protein EGW08_015568, partial [Elysia chlorotica]
LLPLPVINSDGTVSNVLRGIVDGSITEIKTPPLVSKPLVKTSNKLFIDSELVSNSAKNLVRNDSSISENNNYYKDSSEKKCREKGEKNSQGIHNDILDEKQKDQESKDAEKPPSQLTSKSEVVEKSIKGLLKGFQKGLTGISGKACLVNDHVDETQKISHNVPEGKNTKTSVIEKTNISNEATKNDKTNRPVERNLFADKEVLKHVGSRWDQTKIREHSDLEKEKEQHRKHYKARSKNIHVDKIFVDLKKPQDKKDYSQPETETSKTVKLVCSPPPLPLIPFLVSEENRTEVTVLENCAQQHKEQSTVSNDRMEQAMVEQPLRTFEDNDLLSSGMWLAPEAHELSQSTGALTFSEKTLETTVSTPDTDSANFASLPFLHNSSSLRQDPAPDQTSMYGRLNPSDVSACKDSGTSERVEYPTNQALNEPRDRITIISTGNIAKECQPPANPVEKIGEVSENGTEAFSKLSPTQHAEAESAPDAVMVHNREPKTIISHIEVNSSDEKATTSAPVSLQASQSLEMPDPSVPALSSSNLAMLSPALGREDQALAESTNSLTLEELGFINALQVMNTLAFQPNTMLVDCTKALEEKYPLDSCQMCKKLLPLCGIRHMQTCLDDGSDDCHSSEHSTSPVSVGQVDDKIGDSFAPVTISPGEACGTLVSHGKVLSRTPAQTTISTSEDNTEQTVQAGNTNDVRLHFPEKLLSESFEHRVQHAVNETTKADILEQAASSNTTIGIENNSKLQLQKEKHHEVNTEKLDKEVRTSGSSVTSSEPSPKEDAINLLTPNSQVHNPESAVHSFETERSTNTAFSQGDKVVTSQNAPEIQNSFIDSTPLASTKLASKESSLNMVQSTAEGGNQTEVFHGTNNGNPQTKILQTEEHSSNSSNGVSDKTSLAGEPETRETPFNYLKTWEQNRLLANDMDSASKQREQRKNILMQVMKQKEKMQKKCDRHEGTMKAIFGVNVQRDHDSSKSGVEEMEPLSNENQKKSEQTHQMNADQEKSKKIATLSNFSKNCFDNKSLEITSKEKLLEPESNKHIPLLETEEAGRKVLKDSQNNCEKHSKSNVEPTTQPLFEQSTQKKDDREIQNKTNKDICLHRTQKLERKEGSPDSDPKKDSHNTTPENHRQQKDKEIKKDEIRFQRKEKTETKAVQDDRKRRRDNETHHKSMKTKEARSDSRRGHSTREDYRQRDDHYKRRRHYENDRERSANKTKENLYEREKKDRDLKVKRKATDWDQRRAKNSVSKVTSTDNLDRENRTRTEEDKNVTGKFAEIKESSQDVRDQAEGLSLLNSEKDQSHKLLLSEQRVEGKKYNEEKSDKNDAKIEDLGRSDQNSNHLVPLDAKNCFKSNGLALTSPIGQAESVMDKEESKQSSNNLDALTEHAGSASANDDSDDDFGVPKKIIKPSKKKIFINLPNPAQKQSTDSSSTAANEITLNKSVADPSVSPLSTTDSPALSHPPKDMIVAPLAKTDTLARKEGKPILSIKIGDTKASEKITEELYSPSNPTSGDQASYESTFGGAFNSISYKTDVKRNQPITHEEPRSSSMQNITKPCEDLGSFAANQTLGTRNVFSLYTSFDENDSNFFGVNNDFGDVDYRQGANSRGQMSVEEKGFTTHGNNNCSTSHAEKIGDNNIVPPKSMPAWNKDYYSQETYHSRYFSRGTGFWQDFPSANFGDTDYRQRSEVTSSSYWKESHDVKSESTEEWAAWKNGNSLSSSVISDWSHSHGGSQSGDSYSQNPTTSRTDTSRGVYWTLPTGFNTDPAEHNTSQDVSYQFSNSMRSPEQSQEKQKVIEPIDETSATLQKILPEMFTPTSHQQKCQNILKAFSQSSSPMIAKPVLPAEEEDEDESFIYGADPTPEQPLQQFDSSSSTSLHQQTPNTAYEKQRVGEMSSVEKLKEILANVKKRAKNVQASKIEAPVSSCNAQTTNQNNILDENAQLPLTGEMLQEENTKGSENKVVSPEPSSLPKEITMTPKQTEPSVSSQCTESANHIDQLVRKISVEGISLQNLTTVDALKKILNHLTEKIHASISENDSKDTPTSSEKDTPPSSEKPDASKLSSRNQPVNWQGKKPPVVCLSEVFKSSDMERDEDNSMKATAQVSQGSEVQFPKLGDHEEQQKEKCLSRACGQETDNNLTVSESKEASCSATSQKANSADALHRVHGNKLHTFIPEESLMKDDGDQNNARLVSKDDTGRLQVKVSNSRTTQNASVITDVRNTSSLEGMEFKSKKNLSFKGCEKSKNVVNECQDSRVVVIDSPPSPCGSPMTEGCLTQSSSILSISARDDGKVYLSDVSMDALAFARDKILNQINELVDNVDEAEEEASSKCVEDAEETLSAAAVEEDSSARSPAVSCPEQTEENSGQHSEPQDADNDTEDGEIKDNDEDELSDNTVCRDESDDIENISDVDESYEHESALQDAYLDPNKRLKMNSIKKKDEVVLVSSESETNNSDIEDNLNTRTKTTRGVFCKKNFGSLRLTSAYIEYCKKKRRKKKQRHKSKDSGLNDLVIDYKYSDISEASNISEDVDSQLRHTITSPLKFPTQITSKVSPSSKKQDLSQAKLSAAESTIKTSMGKKRNIMRSVKMVEKYPPETGHAENKSGSGLSVAKADSSSDWSRKAISFSTRSKNRHHLEKQGMSPLLNKEKGYAESWKPSPLKVTSSTSDKKVTSTLGKKNNESNSSPDSDRKTLPKLSSVVNNPPRFCHEKSRVSKSPSRDRLEKTISPTEVDCSKRINPDYNTAAKARDMRSSSQDRRKRKRGVSPGGKYRSRRSTSRSPTPRGTRSSRSSSRGYRRKRDSSSECSSKRGPDSPRFKRKRRSRSSSRDYGRRRQSRSISPSPAKHRKRSPSYYIDPYRSPSTSERRYKKYNRDSTSANRRNRDTSSRRSSSHSASPDRSVVIRKRGYHRSLSGDRSPSPKKKFNNELDYYTSRSTRGRSPVWKELPTNNFNKEPVERSVRKSVDHLGLDYYTTKKRRNDVRSPVVHYEDDSREVHLITPERKDKKLSDYEELMKEYERERHRKNNICNVTIEKLIITHYGTIIPEEVKDAFPLSFTTSVTHDSKGAVRTEDDMCKFGKMILEAYGVATSITDNPVNTAKIDFRSRCFDAEFGNYQLQEFSDYQILLEVNVIKQCQAILHADSSDQLSAEAKLKDKSVEQAELKAKLLNMETNKELVSSQDLEELKKKLALVEEEFSALMEACVKQKQLQASKGVDSNGSRKDLPSPDLPGVLQVSTEDFQFCELLHPIPDGQVKADLEALLDQVAGDILELYKCPDFGRAHFRVPDLLLLQEEKRSLYALCGTPLILSEPISKGTFLSLLGLRQKLESLGPKVKDSAEGNNLLAERSTILARHVEEVKKRTRLNRLRERMRQFVCCTEYLRKVLGSDGMRKMKVLETYEQALQWHFRFLEQEFFEC